MSPAIIALITAEVGLTIYSLKRSGVLTHMKQDVSNLASKAKESVCGYKQSIKDNYNEGRNT